MKNRYDIIPPHADIRKGHFDDVVAKATPDAYHDRNRRLVSSLWIVS
jgi:hypothetical protein